MINRKIKWKLEFELKSINCLLLALLIACISLWNIFRYHCLINFLIYQYSTYLKVYGMFREHRKWMKIVKNSWNWCWKGKSVLYWATFDIILTNLDYFKDNCTASLSSHSNFPWHSLVFEFLYHPFAPFWTHSSLSIFLSVWHSKLQMKVKNKLVKTLFQMRCFQWYN